MNGLSAFMSIGRDSRLLRFAFFYCERNRLKVPHTKSERIQNRIIPFKKRFYVPRVPKRFLWKARHRVRVAAGRNARLSETQK